MGAQRYADIIEKQTDLDTRFKSQEMLFRIFHEGPSRR